jgi:heptosyltransferase-3
MTSLKRAEAGLRRIGGWLGGLVAAGLARPPAPDGRPRSILVIRIDERVGNLLLTTPLLERLRAALPDARLDMLVAAGKRAVVEGRVGTVPFEKRDLFRRPWRFLATLARLRRSGYDVAIDASHWHTFSATSALLLAWTGAPIRICHDRGPAVRFASHAVPSPAESEPEVLTKLRLLAPLSLAAGPATLSTALGTDPEVTRGVAEWADPLTLGDRPLVGLLPGARKADHRAPPTLFAAVGRAARAHGAVPVVLWGPGEESLAREVAEAGAASLAPPTDLEALAGAIRRCAVVVTNDTGPMHLAVATGTPTIAVFVKGDPRRWGHSDPPHLVIDAETLEPDAVEARVTAAVLERLGPRSV